MMDSIELTCGTFACPSCGAEYTLTQGDQYRDDITDGLAQQCERCSGWYQMRCVGVAIDMEVTIAPKQQEDQIRDRNR